MHDWTNDHRNQSWQEKNELNGTYRKSYIQATEQSIALLSRAQPWGALRGTWSQSKYDSSQSEVQRGLDPRFCYTTSKITSQLLIFISQCMLRFLKLVLNSWLFKVLKLLATWLFVIKYFAYIRSVANTYDSSLWLSSDSSFAKCRLADQGLGLGNLPIWLKWWSLSLQLLLLWTIFWVCLFSCLCIYINAWKPWVNVWYIIEPVVKGCFHLGK